MKMRIRKFASRLLATVLICMLSCQIAAFASDDTAQLEEVHPFQSVLSELIHAYGVAQNPTLDAPCYGVIGGVVQDLNLDGQDEMLVLYATEYGGAHFGLQVYELQNGQAVATVNETFPYSPLWESNTRVAISSGGEKGYVSVEITDMRVDVFTAETRIYNLTDHSYSVLYGKYIDNGSGYIEEAFVYRTPEAEQPISFDAYNAIITPYFYGNAQNLLTQLGWTYSFDEGDASQAQQVQGFIDYVNALPPPEQVKVYLNGEQIALKQWPVRENDRILAPMRPIFEALGAFVAWDESAEAVTAWAGDNTITVYVNNTAMWLNSQPETLDTPPRIIGDTTMVPLRAVSQALGATVTWDEDSSSVYITQP